MTLALWFIFAALVVLILVISVRQEERFTLLRTFVEGLGQLAVGVAIVLVLVITGIFVYGLVHWVHHASLLLVVTAVSGIFGVFLFGAWYIDSKQNQKIRSGDLNAIENRVTTLMTDSKYSAEKAIEAVIALMMKNPEYSRTRAIEVISRIAIFRKFIPRQ